jgi:hypothetical protein
MSALAAFRRRARWLLLVLGGSACGEEQAAPAGPCAVRLPAEAAPQAMLVSFTSDEALGGSFGCAATLIAPNLMLTAAHCVSRQVPGPFACDPENGWQLVEDGSGRGRVGELYAADAVSITERTERGLSRTVARGRELIAFGASTRCRDDLAAIVLDRELAIEALPLRLTPDTQRDELLTLAHFDAGLRTRLLEPVQVSELSSPLASVEAPPRTLRLGDATCGAVGGEPVFSPASGALVALSFHALPGAGDCAAGADVLALQLSEYGAFLEDAAARAGTELYVEAAPDAPEGDAHCAPRVSSASDAGSPR